MKCSTCGNENPAVAELCEACGADLIAGEVLVPLTTFDRSLMTDLVDALVPKSPVMLPLQNRTVDDAITLMQQHNIGCVLVGEDQRIEGVFTESDIFYKFAPLGRPPADVAIDEVMTHDPVVLRHDDTVAVALHKMVIGHFRHIPLMDADGRADGIISARDILRYLVGLLDAKGSGASGAPAPARGEAQGRQSERELDSAERLGQVSVKRALETHSVGSLTLHPVVDVKPDDPLADALNVMRERASAYALIFDTDSRQLVGIFTERDLFKRALGPEGLAEGSIADYMTRDPVTVPAADSTLTALRPMVAGSFRHLPVRTESGEYAGVLDIHCLMHFLAELLPDQVLNLPPRPHQVMQSREGA